MTNKRPEESIECMKNWLVSLVMTIALFTSFEGVFSSGNVWKYETISNVLSNQYLQSKNGEVLKIAGITGMDLDFPTRQDQPYVRPVFWILKNLLKGEKVRILREGIAHHIKIKPGEKWVLLSEWLLENGYGHYSPVLHKTINPKLQKAELSAQQNKRGIWGKTEFKKSISKLRENASVMTHEFQQKYGHLSAPISSVVVKRVISGNEIGLENGARVKLLGVRVPSFDDSRKAYACFGEQAQKYLEYLLLGREVMLERDITDRDEKRRFLRYVKIPGDPNYLHSEIHINKELVRNGYAKSYWPNDIDKKYREEFNALQDLAYQEMNGAWGYCLSQIVNPAREEKVLVYDEDCPIKANISKGKYTYHTPESGWYKRIKPERCFVSESDAEEAGFVKVK